MDTGNPIVIYTSPTGRTWTQVTTGPIAESTGVPGRMVYNPDDGRYAFTSALSGHIYYSDDDMVNWSTSLPNSNRVFDIEYGNGIWMVSYFTNGYYYSNDNMATWNSTSTPFNAYNIVFHENSNRFFIGGGIRQGDNDYDARIAYTTNGSSWVTTHTGTDNVYVNVIKGDKDGNMIAVGLNDDGVEFTGATTYLYSTNNGSTWSASSFPTPVLVYDPNGVFYGDGTVNNITAIEEDPFPAEPDTTPALFNLYGIDLDTYTDYTIPTGANTPSSVAGMFFNPAGDIMFIGGNQGGQDDYIFSYTLSTPFDPSTATYRNRTGSITGGYLGQVAWNDSGTNWYYGGRYISSAIFSHKKDIPFDETSTDLASRSLTFGSDGRWPHPDATYIWQTNTNKDVTRLTLTADGVYPSSASYITYSDVSNSNIAYIQWANNGTYFYAGCTNGKLKRFTCSTPYELNTRSQDQIIDFNSKFFMSHDSQYLFTYTSGVIRRWSFT
jgi:hypothetical protein